MLLWKTKRKNLWWQRMCTSRPSQGHSLPFFHWPKYLGDNRQGPPKVTACHHRRKQTWWKIKNRQETKIKRRRPKERHALPHPPSSFSPVINSSIQPLVWTDTPGTGTLSIYQNVESQSLATYLQLGYELTPAPAPMHAFVLYALAIGTVFSYLIHSREILLPRAKSDIGILIPYAPKLFNYQAALLDAVKCLRLQDSFLTSQAQLARKK